MDPGIKFRVNLNNLRLIVFIRNGAAQLNCAALQQAGRGAASASGAEQLVKRGDGGGTSWTSERTRTEGRNIAATRTNNSK